MQGYLAYIDEDKGIEIQFIVVRGQAEVWVLRGKAIEYTMPLKDNFLVALRDWISLYLGEQNVHTYQLDS